MIRRMAEKPAHRCTQFSTSEPSTFRGFIPMVTSWNSGHQFGFSGKSILTMTWTPSLRSLACLRHPSNGPTQTGQKLPPTMAFRLFRKKQCQTSSAGMHQTSSSTTIVSSGLRSRRHPLKTNPEPQRDSSAIRPSISSRAELSTPSPVMLRENTSSEPSSAFR